jgi:hypothetical protein
MLKKIIVGRNDRKEESKDTYSAKPVDPAAARHSGA